MLPTHLQSAPRLFHGVRFDVHAVEHAGRRRQIVVHPGAVVILPLLDPRTVVMIRNYRVAVGQELWELPAGTLEPGEPPGAPETPGVCAARELIEETGYQAASLRRLTSFYSSPGICTETMHCFLATGLTQVGQHLDEGETITVHRVSLAQTHRMIQDGEIRDGKTIAALLYHLTFAEVR